MSVKVCVYLRDDRVPTSAEWQAALDKAALPLRLDDFSLREHWGFVPCQLEGRECGFEYWFGALEAQDEDLRDQIADRDRVVTLVWHGRVDDMKAAIYAAAVLTDLSQGVFCDLQSGDFATGRGVFELMRQAQEAERERGRRAAQKDAAITKERCPHCGVPCPSYRKTCKACGRGVGRATP